MSTVHDLDRLATHTSGSRAYGWWGMVWLIATEAMMFAALLASYLYIRFQSQPEWPPPPLEKPELALALIMSAILFSSSIPVHIADRGVRKGNQRALRFGLLGGFVLGAAFIGLQLGIEFPEKFSEFSAQDHAYGSLFYSVIGLHGLHVAVGLVFCAWTLVRAWRGAFDAERHVTVQNFAMYWHFVDVVWLFVLITLYLSPHL